MAFHPYPQLIQAVFNLHWFGPPPDVTRGSTWPWIDHSVSGLMHITIALFRLAFATASPALILKKISAGLTSLYTITRRFIMQKARRHPTSVRKLRLRPSEIPISKSQFSKFKTKNSKQISFGHWKFRSLEIICNLVLGVWNFEVRERSSRTEYRAPTACRLIVSGSISLPSRGSFQFSLTVLVHYRSSESI